MDAKAEKIIAKLNGVVATAKLCRCTKGAVSQWKQNGIPEAREMFLRAVRPDAFEDEVANEQRVA